MDKTVGAFAMNEYGGPLKGYSHQLWLREGWYMGGWSVKFCFKGKDYTAGDVEDLGHPRLRQMVASEKHISFSVPARMPLQHLNTHARTYCTHTDTFTWNAVKKHVLHS